MHIKFSLPTLGFICTFFIYFTCYGFCSFRFLTRHVFAFGSHWDMHKTVWAAKIGNPGTKNDLFVLVMYNN